VIAASEATIGRRLFRPIAALLLPRAGAGMSWLGRYLWKESIKDATAPNEVKELPGNSRPSAAKTEEVYLYLDAVPPALRARRRRRAWRA
jgi:hypothetical protein